MPFTDMVLVKLSSRDGMSDKWVERRDSGLSRGGEVSVIRRPLSYDLRRFASKDGAESRPWGEYREYTLQRIEHVPEDASVVVGYDSVLHYMECAT